MAREFRSSEAFADCYMRLLYFTYKGDASIVSLVVATHPYVSRDPVITSYRTLALIAHTSGSAMAEGPRDALVSRNSATTKHPI